MSGVDRYEDMFRQTKREVQWVHLRTRSAECSGCPDRTGS